METNNWDLKSYRKSYKSPLIKFSVCQSFSFSHTLLLDGTLFNHQFSRCFLFLLPFFFRPCPISSDLPAKQQSDYNCGVLSLPLHSITKCRNPFFIIWILEISFVCQSKLKKKKWNDFGAFNLHLLEFTFVYQFYSRNTSLVESTFWNPVELFAFMLFHNNFKIIWYGRHLLLFIFWGTAKWQVNW